jgi:hypothetical protein
MSLDFFGIGSGNLLEVVPQPTPGHLGWGLARQTTRFPLGGTSDKADRCSNMVTDCQGLELDRAIHT